MAQHLGFNRPNDNNTAGGSGAGAGNAEGKIRAAHLLVKHNGSRRPASWRNPEIIQSKEEARSVLEGYEQRIKSEEITLGDLASTESDCSSAKKGGDLYAILPLLLLLVLVLLQKQSLRLNISVCSNQREDMRRYSYL